MAKIHKSKTAGRCMVEVKPKVGKDFEAIRTSLGEPKKITLATAALSYVINRVNSGELVLTNGELRPAA